MLLEGSKVEAIHWAMDGSHRLIIWSASGAISHVTDIALDVASRLGGRFVVDTKSLTVGL